MPEQNMIIHLVAGGVAGTTGAILTCPLEVIKTRFQSSSNSYHKLTTSSSKPSQTGTLSANTGNSLNKLKLANKIKSYSFSSSILFKNNHFNNHHTTVITNGFNFETQLDNRKNLRILLNESKSMPGTRIFSQFKYIIKNEGYQALFKGLGPTLIGVAPYRAIYFFSYANSKSVLGRVVGEERALLHICSAFIAGFSAVTITNPIWFVKTRMQLDESRRGMSALEVINKIMKEKGPLGFYKGISASYFGIVESAMYFAVYEKLKILSNRQLSSSGSEDNIKFFSCFTSAGFSKTLASCICYPHEVARTRLRQEGNKYTGFFQTLGTVIREEGFRGLYKGMGTHLVRQIPNTAIVMTTYELIVNRFQYVENSYEEMYAEEDE